MKQKIGLVPVAWAFFAVRLMRDRPDDLPQPFLQLSDLPVREARFAEDGVELVSNITGKTGDVAHGRELATVLFLTILHHAVEFLARSPVLAPRVGMKNVPRWEHLERIHLHELAPRLVFFAHLFVGLDSSQAFSFL